MSPKFSILLVIAVAVLAGSFVLAGGSSAPTEDAHAVSDAAAEPAEEPHTVIVLAAGEEAASSLVADRLCGASASCENGKDGVVVATLLGGTLPAGTGTATVETDTNCTPDAYGISHCSNILKLADGALIEVRHDHNMQVYPCLDPGETVTVTGQPAAVL